MDKKAWSRVGIVFLIVVAICTVIVSVSYNLKQSSSSNELEISSGDEFFSGEHSGDESGDEEIVEEPIEEPVAEEPEKEDKPKKKTDKQVSLFNF